MIINTLRGLFKRDLETLKKKLACIKPKQTFGQLMRRSATQQATFACIWSAI
nr:hypothetical protein [Haliscomenobacter sp.]